jgi:hypothetical protein
MYFCPAIANALVACCIYQEISFLYFFMRSKNT